MFYLSSSTKEIKLKGKTATLSENSVELFFPFEQ